MDPHKTIYYYTVFQGEQFIPVSPKHHEKQKEILSSCSRTGLLVMDANNSKKRICENMRVAATDRSMCIKHFGMEELARQNKNYDSNHRRRNAVYKTYKDHVNIKSIKKVPTSWQWIGFPLPLATEV